GSFLPEPHHRLDHPGDPLGDSGRDRAVLPRARTAPARDLVGGVASGSAERALGRHCPLAAGARWGGGAGGGGPELPRRGAARRRRPVWLSPCWRYARSGPTSSPTRAWSRRWMAWTSRLSAARRCASSARAAAERA